MHQRVLEEVAGSDHPLEFVGADEVVVLGMALARARCARGERNRQADVRVARQAGVDDAGFSGTGGRGDDVEGSAHAHLMLMLIRCSGSVRGPGRSAPSTRPPPAKCAYRPTWNRACWPRG